MSLGLAAPPPAQPGQLARRLGLGLVQTRMFDAPAPTLGRYVVAERIGAGGMGTVFRAHDPLLDRPLAIKVLHRGDGDGQRALAEARTLARLSHPNVLGLFDVGFEASQLWIATELMEGGTLRDWLSTRPGRRWREVLARFMAAGEGLAAAHRAGVVHRDFKPDNVLVGLDGRMRVADFGLASSSPLVAPADRRKPAREGTPRYWAPEVEAGHEATPISDQYSYFVSLREALAGSDLDDDAPPAVIAELRGLVDRGAAATPTDRHPSMTVALRSMAALLDRATSERPRRAPGGLIRLVDPGQLHLLEAARELDDPDDYRAAALAWLDQHIGFDTALLGRPEALTTRGLRVENFDPAFVARFRADPMRYAGPLMQLGQLSALEQGPVRDVDVFGLAQREKLPFYNELIGPKGSKVMLVGALVVDGAPVGSLQISRTGRGASFSDRELRAVRRLLAALAEGEALHR